MTTDLIPGIVLIVAAYFIGSISFAKVVSRLMRLPDPHSYGSKNPGATNVLRTGNKKAAALTLLGDALKGFVVVFVTIHLGRYGYLLPEWVLPGVLLAVFLGHVFPIYHQFKGGKGVATIGGMLLALNWVFGLVLIVVWLVMAFGLKISSLAALTAALVMIAGGFYLYGTSLLAWTLLILALLTIWRHRDNIARLVTGKEGKITNDKS